MVLAAARLAACAIWISAYCSSSSVTSPAGLPSTSMRAAPALSADQYTSHCTYLFSKRLIRFLLSSACCVMICSRERERERPAFHAIKTPRVEIDEQVEAFAHSDTPYQVPGSTRLYDGLVKAGSIEAKSLSWHSDPERGFPNIVAVEGGCRFDRNAHVFVIDPPGDPARLVGSPAADSTTATDVKLTIKLSILGLGDTRGVSTDIAGYQWVLPDS